MRMNWSLCEYLTSNDAVLGVCDKRESEQSCCIRTSIEHI